MKTSTFQSAKNENGTYVSFELPEGISFTRKLKETKARIDFSLKTSNQTSVGGTCFFKSIEDAQKAYELNVNKNNVICKKPVAKGNSAWI